MIQTKIKQFLERNDQSLNVRQNTLDRFLGERKVGPSTITLIKRLTMLYEKGGRCIVAQQEFTDRLFLMALMTRESSLIQNAQNSRSTAFGLLQVINGNWRLSRKVDSQLRGYPWLFKKYIQHTEAWRTFTRINGMPNYIELFTPMQRKDALNNVNFNSFIYTATISYAKDVANSKYGVSSSMFENQIAYNLFLCVLHHDWVPFLELCKAVKSFVNAVNPTVGINELTSIIKKLPVRNRSDILDAHAKLTALVTSESLAAAVVTADQYMKAL